MLFMRKPTANVDLGQYAGSTSTKYASDFQSIGSADIARRLNPTSRSTSHCREIHWPENPRRGNDQDRGSIAGKKRTQWPRRASQIQVPILL